MTDLQFYNLIKYVASGTTIANGEPYVKYIEDCFEDEIELSRNIQYPALFMTPNDCEIISQTQIKYSVKLAVAIGSRDRTKREEVFSDAIKYASNLISNLPEDINIVGYPIRITKGLMFDDAVEGIAFELSMTDGISCSDDEIEYPALPFPAGGSDGQIVYWDEGTGSFMLSSNALIDETGNGLRLSDSFEFLSLDGTKSLGQWNSPATGGQIYRLENSSKRYGLAIYNSTPSFSIGVQSLATGTGANQGGVFGAKNGTTNYALRIPSTYPESGTTNYAIYSESGAKSFFNGNVGIGTTASDGTDRLIISGGTIKISDGTEGEGKILVSDSGGTGSWRSGRMNWKGTFSQNNRAYSIGDVVNYTNESTVSGLYICTHAVVYKNVVWNPEDTPTNDTENWETMLETATLG